MLIFRVETCISLFGPDKRVPAGIGPYGTRDMMRQQLNRGYALYTLEEKEKIESYVRNRGLFLFSHKECKMDTHPAPTNDTMLMSSFESKGERPVIRGYHFGFNSTEQLKTWFNESSRISLHLQGYYVAIYEVKEFHEGETQCIFMKETAELVGFKSCLEV